MILQTYAIVGLVVTGRDGFGILQESSCESLIFGKEYGFGFAAYPLVFAAFDMKIIVIYPSAMVSSEIGLKVFIALLGGDVAHAWRMGGLILPSVGQGLFLPVEGGC